MSSPTTQVPYTSQALDDVVAERQSQIAKYDVLHDDLHGPVHLAQAGIAYAERNAAKLPWKNSGPLGGKPYRKALVQATALMLAAIESYDRLNDTERAEYEAS